jgi:hypothetical protein
MSDAYHSLSIEGYSVTPELIDCVRSDWNPKADKRTNITVMRSPHAVIGKPFRA